MAHTWVKDYTKYDGCDYWTSENISMYFKYFYKSQLVKVIYNTISKTLLYHHKNSEKPRLGPMWISAVKLGGTTIQSGVGVQVKCKASFLNK